MLYAQVLFSRRSMDSVPLFGLSVGAALSEGRPQRASDMTRLPPVSGSRMIGAR